MNRTNSGTRLDMHTPGKNDEFVLHIDAPGSGVSTNGGASSGDLAIPDALYR